jgi:thioredoxin-related protein
MTNMKTINYKAIIALLVFAVTLPQLSYAVGEIELTPAMVNPGHEQVPDWFKVSFLDLHEDVAEAAEDGKRVMVFFFQDGCPYCKKLLEDNFGQRAIAEKTQKYFDVVTLNIWGDREVTVGDKTLTEKQFAEALKVQYTPTLMFFNENNKVVFRANGYYPPEKFNAVLDYVGMHKEKKLSYQAYLAKVDPQPSTGKLHTGMINIKNPDNLREALEPGKHLLVMFEQKRCATCDELHADILRRPESTELLNGLNIALFDMWSNEKIIRPDGKKTKISDWAKQLDIKYAPSLVYFNDKGEEVFRSDAYLKAFHTLSVMDYVSSNAYKEQPNFQRYISERADRLREQGVEVILMQ